MRNRHCLKTQAVCLVLVIVATAGCRRHSADGEPPAIEPVRVRTSTAQVRRILLKTEAPATIRAEREAAIAAQITSPIERINVKPGDAVKRGDLLVKIDETEIRARLLQAEAQFRQAESSLQREKILFERNASNISKLEAAEATYRVTRGLVDEVKTILSYASLRAPFDGIITEKLMNLGDLATPGKPLLILEDPARLRAEAAVPEALATHISLGQELAVSIGSLQLQLRGTVSEIAPVADPVSRTVLVKIDLPPHPQLRSGRFARVSLPGEMHDALLVPATAVRHYGQLERIFVVEEGKARLRLIKTGAGYGVEIEILAGLDAGDTVIVSADTQLRDGAPVEVEP